MVKKDPNGNTSLASCMIDSVCFSEKARIVSPSNCAKNGSSLNKGFANLFRWFKEIFDVDEIKDGLTSPEVIWPDQEKEIVEKMLGEKCFVI